MGTFLFDRKKHTSRQFYNMLIESVPFLMDAFQLKANSS